MMGIEGGNFNIWVSKSLQNAFPTHFSGFPTGVENMGGGVGGGGVAHQIFDGGGGGGGGWCLSQNMGGALG